MAAKKRAPSPPSPADEFIVNTIFPKRELHLIGGAAHSGKTSLLLHIMDNWRAGRKVFGYESYPTDKLCYVSCVHTIRACRKALAKTDLGNIPTVSLFSKNKAKNFDEMWDLVRREAPETEVIFLDGISRISGGISGLDNGQVGDFLINLISAMEPLGLTIIATGRCAKPRESRSTIRTIDRFLGATAWTEISSTFIAIEQRNPNRSTDDRRVITVMPKDAPCSVLHYRFNSAGRLTEVASDMDADSADAIDVLTTVLTAHEAGHVFQTSDLLDIGRDMGILSRSTMMKYLALLLKQGKLSDGGHGKYILPRLQ